jgi:hypothetical protein
VSKLLAENRHFRMHDELGTGPGFYYVWDQGKTEADARALAEAAKVTS